jgi:hypothetical protein
LQMVAQNHWCCAARYIQRQTHVHDLNTNVVLTLDGDYIEHVHYIRGHIIAQFSRL